MGFAAYWGGLMKFILSAALLLLAGNFARAGDHRPDSLATDDDIRSLAVGTVELIDVDFAIAPNPTVGNKTVIEAQQGNSPRQIKLFQPAGWEFAKLKRVGSE